MSFYDLNATFRPIDVWPGKETRNRERSRFKAEWRQTRSLLARELAHLQAKNIVCQLALREQDIRLDGYPRANARPTHPGVILAFDSKYGPLRYPCDTFDDWQDNVRAIALAMEKLRAVDRYGVTRRGEQYAGWKALPASSAHPAMTVDQAARFVSEHDAGSTVGVGAILSDRKYLEFAYRNAAKKLHPDTGGDTAKFQLLQEAKRVLDAHHGNGTAVHA